MDPELPAQLHNLLILPRSVSLVWAITQPTLRFELGDEDFSQLLSYSVGSAVAIASGYSFTKPVSAKTYCYLVASPALWVLSLDGGFDYDSIWEGVCVCVIFHISLH